MPTLLKKRGNVQKKVERARLLAGPARLDRVKMAKLQAAALAAAAPTKTGIRLWRKNRGQRLILPQLVDRKSQQRETLTHSLRPPGR